MARYIKVESCGHCPFPYLNKKHGGVDCPLIKKVITEFRNIHPDCPLPTLPDQQEEKDGHTEID